MSRNDRSSGVELPRIIPDSENGVTYEKGRFLGKGGFAKCYEFVRVENKQLYAGKVVPKTLLQTSHQKVIVYTCVIQRVEMKEVRYPSSLAEKKKIVKLPSL